MGELNEIIYIKNLSQYKALSLNYYYYYYNHLRHHIWRLYSIKLELRIQSQLCHLLVVWPWACHLISLHFSHLWNGDNNSAYHIMFSEGLIEVLPMEYLGQCLTHCKCLVSIIIISLWTPWIRDHHVYFYSPHLIPLPGIVLSIYVTGSKNVLIILFICGEHKLCT